MVSSVWILTAMAMVVCLRTIVRLLILLTWKGESISTLVGKVLVKVDRSTPLTKVTALAQRMLFTTMKLVINVGVGHLRCPFRLCTVAQHSSTKILCKHSAILGTNLCYMNNLKSLQTNSLLFDQDVPVRLFVTCSPSNDLLSGYRTGSNPSQDGHC